jgi:hypothetical protein
MTRLYLFAEGQTEQTYADTVLRPHLAALGVYMHGPILVAHCRKKGLVHRGGGRRYVPMRNDILRFLRQQRGADVRFTTMIDLYGIYGDFPSIAEVEHLRPDPRARVEALEAAWLRDIGDDRFIPYIQLHEFEALLFTNPQDLSLFYTNSAAEIRGLQAISHNFDSPELINDGDYTAPSKRIIAKLPDYKGAKRIVGPMVAELIGLHQIRARCPHFNGWLTRLEALAQ